MRLEGKVAIVTGATKGIGRVIAASMAREGASIVIAGRTVSRGEEMVEAIRKDGGEATFVETDIGDEAGVKSLIAAAEARYGKLTTLVNNAASTELINRVDGPVGDVSLEGWESILRVTLTGTMLMSKYAIPAMIRAGGGSVVNISSEASYKPPSGMSAYAAAKAAMNSLSRSIAVEYGADNIRSNVIITGMVLPPHVRPKFEADPVIGPKLRAQHLTRLGLREDIAYAAIFLASDESGFVTGTELPVEGGAGVMSNIISKEEIFQGGA